MWVLIVSSLDGGNAQDAIAELTWFANDERQQR